MKTGNLLLAAATVAGCSLLPTAQANLIAYEGFLTSEGNGTDFNDVGATGFGFSNPDASSTNFRMDIENGLSYTDNFGNSLLVGGKSAGMEAIVGGTQNLQLGLLSPITNSGTVYMSFLMDIAAVNSWGVAAGLTTGQVGDSASPTTSLEAALRSTSTNYGLFSDGLLDARTGPPSATGLFFFVAELDMDAETMTGYLNPGNLLDVANTSTTMTGTLDGTWATMDSFIFSLGGDAAGTIDEIRIGTTMGSVTPVPEPAHLAFIFGLASLAFIATRRRFLRK